MRATEGRRSSQSVDTAPSSDDALGTDETAGAPNASTQSRDTRFWVFWGATSISTLGSAVTTVALPLTAVLVLDASAGQMGVLAAAGYLAWLIVGLPAGAIVLRLPLRGVQVAMDLVRAAALTSVPLAWWLDVLTYPHLVVCALAMSFAGVFYDVANSTFMPRVVPADHLQARNSLMGGTLATMQLGGPSLGGLLVAFLGPVVALLADVVSYVASALLLFRLPKVPRADHVHLMHKLRATRLVRDGWFYVVRHPVVGPCMWAAAALNFVCGAQLALFALYLVHSTGASPQLVGFLLASDAVGSLLAACVVTAAVARLGSARVTVGACVLSVAGAMLLPAGRGEVAWLCFFVGNAVFAAGVATVSITTRTYRQVTSPPQVLSRVMSTVRFVSWGAVPVGSLAAGLIASYLDAATALWITGAVSALAPGLLLVRGVGSTRDLLVPSPALGSPPSTH